MTKKDIKKNIKKVGCMLVSLFLMGITGLFISLGELNARYETKGRTIGILSGEVLKLKYRIDDNKQKIANYLYMEYKTNAFSKRFPEFSSILDVIYKKSFLYGFKPALVLGIIKVESDYNPRAVSYRGAYGLMQVNLEVWKNELGIDRKLIFDIAYNIDTGLKILKKYYDMTDGNIKRAIHLYNNGYKYNNTAYTTKVDSAVLSFSSQAPMSTVGTMEPLMGY
jgi:hypothetical protein